MEYIYFFVSKDETQYEHYKSTVLKLSLHLCTVSEVLITTKLLLNKVLLHENIKVLHYILGQ